MLPAKPLSTTSNESIDALTLIKSALVAAISAFKAASIAFSLPVALSISEAKSPSTPNTLVSNEVMSPSKPRMSASLLVICL
jgi:hypothetical protein